MLDVSRAAAIAARVGASSDPAWLFFTPVKAGVRGGLEFHNPQPGPGPYTEQTFEARLLQLGVSYPVVRLGVLDAVMPAQRESSP